MKHIQRWLLRLIVALVIIGIVGVSVGTWVVRRPWAEADGTLKVAGLTAPVQVIRDHWGIPNIYAQNEHDLFFAQGYVHAQDRLWQMEMIRRISSGRMSEVMGSASLEVDRYLRGLGLRRLAEASLPTYDADLRAVLENYAAGVNAYIDSHRDRLPIEFTMMGITPEPWTPVDTLSWSGLMAVNMGLNAWIELLRAKVVAKLGVAMADELLNPPEDVSLLVPPEAHGYQWLRSTPGDSLAAIEPWLPSEIWGSNNWVVSGSRTATGKPMLANDTHLSLYIPSYWYEVGLHGGRFDSVGFSFPGIPLIVTGHNQNIGWGMTNLDGDVQDLYIEKLDDRANPKRYEYKGEWHDLRVITETIKVKGADPVSMKIMFTQHGPIINEAYRQYDAEPMALSWTLFNGSTIFRAIRDLNLAKDWDSFRAALRYWDTLGENFVYIDVQGNIGYQAAARIPIRTAKHSGMLPVPGWTGEYEWQGFVPLEELPHSFNPDKGFIATANNRENAIGFRYPVTNDWQVSSFRAKRISDLLAANAHVSLDDMRTMQADTYSLIAQGMRPYLIQTQTQNELQAKALELIKTWNFRFDVDSPGALIFRTWYRVILEDTFKDELGDLFQDGNWGHRFGSILITVLRDEHSHWFDDVTTAQHETRADILSRSLARTVDTLSQQYGQDPAQWKLGQLHVIAFKHLPFGQSGIAPLEMLFNSRNLAMGGDSDTIDSVVMSPGTSFGSSQRMILSAQDWTNSLAVNSTGQSGQLFHPHREDQIQMWQQVQYHPMPFNQAAVKAGAEAVLTLTP